MTSAIQRCLFPAQMRALPYRRTLLNLFRSVHILCVSIYVGGLYFGQSDPMLQGWLFGAVLSGLALLALDLYASCILLCELRGISVIAKVVALLTLPLLSHQQQLWLLMAVIVLSAFVSHSARRIRHHNLVPAGWRNRLGIVTPSEKR